ncbi:MAG: hypothetical protein PHT78_01520 [Desulfitobacteriaceae bacterium]|nr:hypothetical protein [Desulfitobacteriaceae bacterium]
MNFISSRGKILLTTAAGAFFGYYGAKWTGRKLVNTIADSSIRTIMTDSYDENLWEFISASNRVGQQVIVETNMRAQEGTLINRPLGSLGSLTSKKQLKHCTNFFFPVKKNWKLD